MKTCKWYLLLCLALVLHSCNEDDVFVDPIENLNTVDGLSNEVAYSWVNLFMETERYANNIRPVASARAMAYIQLAAYETALPGMPEQTSNSGRIPGFLINETVNTDLINWEIALNECYAQTMRHFLWSVPTEYRKNIDSLENEIDHRLSAEASEDVIRNSELWGKTIAFEIIKYSQTDLNAELQILDPQPRSYILPQGPGLYKVDHSPEEDALFPYWGRVRTFIANVDATQTVAPMPYSSDRNSPYYKEMEEVYTTNNNAREEQNEDLWIAEFWSDDTKGMTFSPPIRLFAIANQLIKKENYDLATTLELFVKMGFVLHDAGVNCWNDKYIYNTERPSHFIEHFIDQNFQTNLRTLNPWPNPTFPGYPSGHSTFAVAGCAILADYFGEEYTFTDNCHANRTEFWGAPRTYTSFTQNAEENAYSRIPLGVHIRQDCVEGVRLGFEVASMVSQYSLKK